MEKTFNVTRTNTNNKAITNCFLWMFLGLGATAISALAATATGLTHCLPFIIGMGVATIAAALVMGIFRKKMSAIAMKVSYGAYTISMGAFLGTLTQVYKLGSIGIAFAISASLFVCLYLAAKVTKIDFTKIGSMCLVGIGVLLISELVLFILHVPYMTLAFTAIALVLFLGVTIFDIQRANEILSSDCLEGEDLNKMTIFFALQLHLDFINIFLRVVELVAKKN